MRTWQRLRTSWCWCSAHQPTPPTLLTWICGWANMLLPDTCWRTLFSEFLLQVLETYRSDFPQTVLGYSGHELGDQPTLYLHSCLPRGLSNCNQINVKTLKLRCGYHPGSHWSGSFSSWKTLHTRPPPGELESLKWHSKYIKYIKNSNFESFEW